MSEYPIVTLLKELSEDEIERELIELIAMDLEDDKILERILLKLEGRK